MTVKNPNTKTIEISTEAYDKLHSAQTTLEKILHKKQVTFDQVIKMFFVAEPLDVILTNMMLEDPDTKSIAFETKTLPEDHAEEHEE